jgi:hypothetical protein
MALRRDESKRVKEKSGLKAHRMEHFEKTK